MYEYVSMEKSKVKSCVRALCVYDYAFDAQRESYSNHSIIGGC